METSIDTNYRLATDAKLIYGLRLGDFIPVKGFDDYGKRVEELGTNHYLRDNPRNSQTADAIATRETILFLWNGILGFAGLAAIVHSFADKL